ncbi:uncharacterized protein FSUBG_5464 [Fusarium subglutinans]|uniref:C2H2-type domain-containing protein n=1 Tax=Gibberella subglutinans TaxID=42677 RepID=A0A8H5V1E7_GIBSU|nr:uncharacterized protein FSUBG_5464 [Fusarium subglutinans]KAF5607006.1 hypothetical protein FSUBG_5464 [Fusarium subglutinans]
MSLTLEQEMVHLAPEQHVRAILLALLDDRSVKARALNHYRALKAADNPVTGLKRKAMNDLFVCVQCDQAFTHQDNTETSCRYHPGTLTSPDFSVCVFVAMRLMTLGELIVDDTEDFWADHDEDCHGEIDTPEMREEMPDGFRWMCCDKLGGRKGCTKGKHQADPAKSRRGGNVPSGGDMRKNNGEHLPVSDGDSEDEEDGDEEY